MLWSLTVGVYASLMYEDGRSALLAYEQVTSDPRWLDALACERHRRRAERLQFVIHRTKHCGDTGILWEQEADYERKWMDV